MWGEGTPPQGLPQEDNKLVVPPVVKGNVPPVMGGEVGPGGVPACFNCVSSFETPCYFVRDNVLYCDADSRFRVELRHVSLRGVLSVLLLVDSGACFTCVNSVFVRRHNLQVTHVNKTPLYSACGRALRVERCVTLELCFGDVCFGGVRAYVLENLSEEVIVGRDFLARYNLCVHVDQQISSMSKPPVLRILCVVCVTYVVLIHVGRFTSARTAQKHPRCSRVAFSPPSSPSRTRCLVIEQRATATT